MEMEAERDSLAELVQGVVRVVPAHPPVPVLGGIRIDAHGPEVTLGATDLETFVAVRGQTLRATTGSVVVAGRLLAEIVRNLPPGRVCVRADGAHVAIETAGIAFSLAALAPEDFPAPPRVDGAPSLLDAGELARALRQVVPATSADECRPVLTGVAWSLDGEVLRLTATDGYRLAIRELTLKKGPGEGAMVVPGRALMAFARLLGRAGGDGAEAAVSVGGRQAALRAGGATVVTRLIEGRFPDTSQLVADHYPNRLVAERAALLESVARVGLVARAATPIVVELGTEVRLRATERGLGDAVEVLAGATYEGEPVTVALNPRFLMDGLEALEDRRVVLETIDPARPVLLRGEDGADFTYLVMPVRTEGAP
jgi:DNA polymerase-3 subunit beta